MNTVKPLNNRILNLALLLFSLLSFSNVFANDEKQDIDALLKQNKAPDGVVFELIGSENSDYLPNTLKKIEGYKKQLQAKFPKLDIAVVSHGAEQFNLTSNNKDKEKESHSSVQRLVAADVPVHICETHASWRGVTAGDFPEYISPSSQGPTQIKSYQEMAYTLVVIE